MATSPLDPDLVDAVRAGRAIYDGLRAYQCHEALAASSCDKSSPLPQACALPLFAGTLGAQKRCMLDAECKSSVCSCAFGECFGDTPTVDKRSGECSST